MPAPDYHLEIGSASHGVQTGRMLAAVEEVITEEGLDMVLVYGDTNSTLAGALASAKMHVPVAHVEAGLRSNDFRMPEEVNRVLTDHCSDILFCPTASAVTNLSAEGVTKGIHLTGDVMVDALRENLPLAKERIPDLDLPPGSTISPRFTGRGTPTIPRRSARSWRLFLASTPRWSSRPTPGQRRSSPSTGSCRRQTSGWSNRSPTLICSPSLPAPGRS